MDCAFAIGDFRAGGCDRICHRRARQPRAARIDNRRDYLADEHRDHRKRPLNRDRRALRFAFWTCDHLLAELLGAKEIRVAHLDPSVHLSRPRTARQRSGPSSILLRHRARGALEGSKLANTFSSRAFCRAFDHGRTFRGLGDPVCSHSGKRAGDDEVVEPVHRTAQRVRFPISALGPEHSAGTPLSSALDSFFAARPDRHLARALVWGAGVPFVLVLLVPGSIPRYAMPALVPGCWLLAMTLCADNIAWPRWLGGKTFSFKARRRVIVTIAVLACLGIWTYAVAIVPKLQKRQRVRRLAAQIDATVPRSEPLYALDPNYQPIFFYVHSNLVYASEVSDLPLDAVYLLVRPQREDEVVRSNRWSPRQPHRALPPLTDYRKETILLLKIE